MKFVYFPSDPKGFDVVNELSCESTCFKNCSCIAYAFDYKLGCLAWFDEFFDLKQLASNVSYGKNFYLKLPVSELITKDSISTNGTTKDHKISGNRMQLLTIIILTISLSMLMLGLFIYYVRTKLQVKGGDTLQVGSPGPLMTKAQNKCLTI